MFQKLHTFIHILKTHREKVKYASQSWFLVIPTMFYILIFLQVLKMRSNEKYTKSVFLILAFTVDCSLAG